MQFPDFSLWKNNLTACDFTFKKGKRFDNFKKCYSGIRAENFYLVSITLDFEVRKTTVCLLLSNGIKPNFSTKSPIINSSNELRGIQ